MYMSHVYELVGYQQHTYYLAYACVWAGWLKEEAKYSTCIRYPLCKWS